MSNYYEKVMCSQELPKEDGYYIAKSWRGVCNHSFNKVQHTLNKQHSAWLTDIEWWLKPIDLEQIKAQVWEEAIEAMDNHVWAEDKLEPTNPYKQQGPNEELTIN